MPKKDLVRKLFFDIMEASNIAMNKAVKEAIKWTSEKNEYGDAKTFADKYIGEAAVCVLEKSGIPIGLVQEEEEGVRNFNGNNPEYLCVLDEQDGYGLSLEKGFPKHLRFGTMAAILEGENPKWADTVIGGTMEHNPKPRLIYGSAEGSFLKKPFSAKKRIKTSGRKTLRGNPNLLSDTWFGSVNTVFDIPFRKYGIKDVGGSEAGYVDVALGEADALGECTRKDNQEPATSYLMIKNAGGAMYAFTGAPGSIGNFGLEDIGNWNYLGSMEKAKLDRVPILTVATPELGQVMIKHINKSLDWEGPLMKREISLR